MENAHNESAKCWECTTPLPRINKTIRFVVWHFRTLEFNCVKSGSKWRLLGYYPLLQKCYKLPCRGND